MHPEVKLYYKNLSSMGGKARSAKLSKKRKTEIAKNAAEKRWGKKRSKK